ncbi:hypothetical protein F5878DRAFT_637378 [Lentinula raphanica]|uniref:Uncharacterized protein n=1 Tax=Lentinula raphanica TaxID=153919 RepID=A0AA38PKM7_9AGAR|nr:hypothetical protein F5878DRAFT_637378 [Lentinula raphanica]
MANREQEGQATYEYTSYFLASHPSRQDKSNQLAELGYTCLGLHQSLGFCYPNQPWVINPLGEGFDHPSLASLPLNAATNAHFALLAVESPRNYLMSFLQSA